MKKRVIALGFLILIVIRSEKYKGNKLGFINALRIGLKSNAQAKKTGQYSSLIYIIKAEN